MSRMDTHAEQPNTVPVCSHEPWLVRRDVEKIYLAESSYETRPDYQCKGPVGIFPSDDNRRRAKCRLVVREDKLKQIAWFDFLPRRFTTIGQPLEQRYGVTHRTARNPVR